MRGVRSQVNEERSICRNALYEIYHFARENIRFIVGRLVAVTDDPSILIQLDSKIETAHDCVPFIPAGRYISGISRRITIEILSKKNGVIASILQPCGDRGFFQTPVPKFYETSIGRSVSQDTCIVRMLTAQKRSSGRAAVWYIHKV